MWRSEAESEHDYEVRGDLGADVGCKKEKTRSLLNPLGSCSTWNNLIDVKIIERSPTASTQNAVHPVLNSGHQSPNEFKRSGQHTATRSDAVLVRLSAWLGIGYPPNS